MMQPARATLRQSSTMGPMPLSSADAAREGHAEAKVLLSCFYSNRLDAAREGHAEAKYEKMISYSILNPDAAREGHAEAKDYQTGTVREPSGCSPRGSR